MVCKSKSYQRTSSGTLKFSGGGAICDCGGNGAIILGDGRVESLQGSGGGRVMYNRKDGVDAKGEGSSVSLHECIFDKNSRHVQVSGGGTAECFKCEFFASGMDGVAAKGKDTMLKLVSCNIKDSGRAGVALSDGAAGEVRVCLLENNVDSGVLAQGISVGRHGSVGASILRKTSQTKAIVVHCVVRNNGYGVWAQEGAAVKMIGGQVTGSVNSDVTQQGGPSLTQLRSLGGDLRVVFQVMAKGLGFGVWGLGFRV